MGSYKQTLVMKSLTVVMVLVAAVTARPDGPGGHHHHGDHGAHHATHHGAHHADHHGAGHHATHGVQHAPLTTVNLGSSHHVQSPVHTVHSSFSIQPESVHTPESVHQPNVVAPVVVKNSPKSIAELVSSNPKFSTLLTAVKAAGLVDTLAGPGPFTVFAPTNTAFDKVPVEALNGLLADKEALKKTLLRHVVPGATMQGKNIPPGTTTLKTASGEEITATRDKFIQLNSSAGSAYVVLFDVLASNGVVHAVDTVF